MSKKTNDEVPEESVQVLVTWLMEKAEMSFEDIAEAMDHRVSSRTIRRWCKGESQPGNTNDHIELAALVSQKRGAA